MSKHPKGHNKPVDVAVDYLTRLLAVGLQQAMNTGSSDCECEACNVIRAGNTTPQGFKARWVGKLSDGSNVAMPPCLVDYSGLVPPSAQSRKGADATAVEDSVPMLAETVLRQGWVSRMPKGRKWASESLGEYDAGGGKGVEWDPYGIPVEDLDPRTLPVYVQLPLPDPPLDPPLSSHTPWLTFWVPWAARSMNLPPAVALMQRTINEEPVIPLQLCIDVDAVGNVSFKPYALDMTYAILSMPWMAPDMMPFAMQLVGETPAPAVPIATTTDVQGSWRLNNGMTLALTLSGLLRNLNAMLPAAVSAALPPFGLMPHRAPKTVGEVCAIVAACDSEVWSRIQKLVVRWVEPVDQPDIPADSTGADKKDKKSKKAKRAVRQAYADIKPLDSPLTNASDLVARSMSASHFQGDEFQLAAKVAVQHCLRFSCSPKDLSNESCLRVLDNYMQLAHPTKADPCASLTSALVASLRALFFMPIFEKMTWSVDGITASEAALSCLVAAFDGDADAAGIPLREAARREAIPADVHSGPMPESWSWTVANAITVATLTQDGHNSMFGLPTPHVSDKYGYFWSHDIYEQVYSLLQVVDAAAWTPVRVSILIHNALSCLQHMETTAKEALRKVWEGSKAKLPPVSPPLTTVRVMIRILLMQMQVPLAIYCWLCPTFPSLYVDPLAYAPQCNESAQECADDAAVELSALCGYLPNADQTYAGLRDSRSFCDLLCTGDSALIRQLSAMDSRDLQSMFELMSKVTVKLRSTLSDQMAAQNRAVCVFARAIHERARLVKHGEGTYKRVKSTKQRASDVVKKVAELEAKLAEMEKLTELTRTAMQELKGLRTKVSVTEGERNKLRSERDKDRAAVTTAKSQVTSAEGVIKSWEGSVADLEQEMERLASAIRPTPKQHAELAELNAASESASATLSRVNNELTQTRRRIQEQKKQLAAASESASAAERVKAEYTSRLAQCAQEREETVARMARMERDIREAEGASGQEAEAEGEDLRADIHAADAAASLIWQELQAIKYAIASVTKVRDALNVEVSAVSNVVSPPSSAVWASTAPAPSIFGSLTPSATNWSIGLSPSLGMQPALT